MAQLSEGFKRMQWEYNKTNFNRNLAVVIGIDRYKSESIQDLKTPVSDARALADLLETEYGYNKDEKGIRLFDEKGIRLFDEAATLTGLQTLLDKTIPHQLKPTKYDRLIFYFAGHGIPRNSEDGPKGYLVPQDADWQKDGSFLAMSEVYKALSKLECHHLLVILDCCFAGTFRWEGDRRKMIPILETVRREHYDRFIRYPAWQVMTSAAHDQEALDVAKLAEDKRGAVADEKQELHSPFALALLEGLRENKADLIPDGVITAQELNVYVEQQVSKLSGSRQKPGIYPIRLEYDRGEFVFTRPGFTSEQLKPAPLLNESNNPYRGLASFDEKHARFFFGRKILVEELQRRLSQPNRSLTVVLGASGSGKSSLVKAGLIPNLRHSNPVVSGLNLIKACILTETILAAFPQFPLKLLPIYSARQQWYILEPMRPDRSPFTALARAILPIDKPELIEQLDQVSFLDEVFKPKDESGQEDSDEPPDAAFIKLAESWNSATPEAKLLVVEDYFEQLLVLCRNPQEQEQLSQLYQAIFEQLESLRTRLQNESQYLTSVIRKWSETHPAKLLLTIDQFEELITMSQESQTETHGGDRQESDRAAEPQPWLPFLQVLREAIVKCQKLLHIVLTLRSDFEPRFLSSPLSAYWKDARFPVRAMNLDELRQAIEGPALKQALYFEPPELVGKLIEEVGQMPGALPLLSFTLSELYIKLAQRWREDPKSSDRALRIKDYEELGGVVGALTRRASEEYDNLVRDFGEASGKANQATMRRVMLRMVAIEGGGVARRRVPESELVYPDAVENQRVAQVSDRLVKARLLVKGQETGEPYVEPAHDFLVRGWDKLQSWIKQEQEDLALQQRLTPAANDWSTGKGGLWTREVERLARLEKVIELSDNSWLNQREKKFVTESKKQKLDELKEAERQRDEAIQGQISALNSLSEARFRANNQLGALIASVKAGKQLLSAPISVQNQLRTQTVAALQQTVSEIQERNRLQGHKGLIWNISFSPDGKLLASAGYDKTVRLWSVDGSLIKTFEGHSADAVCVSFSPDGKMLASASYDKTVKIWSVDGTLLNTLQNHTEPVTGVSFSPDGKFLASSSYDQTIRLWKTDGTLFQTLKGHDSWIRSVSFSPDSQTIASASDDQTIKLWSCDGKLFKTFKASSDLLLSVSFSPDGQLIASASADNTVKLWSLSGKLLKTLTGHSDQVQGISFSQNSQLIASASGDSTIKIWSRDGTLLQTLRGHSNKVYSVSFSPNDQLIASASGDGTIRLWNWNKTLSKTIRGHDHWVWSVSFSPDSQTLASASGDRTVKLWSRNGTLLQSLSGHLNIVDCVSFSSDGQLIASASADNTVKLWTYDGQELKSLEGHRDRVRGVSFSPDSQMIASTSHDRTIKLWNNKGTLIKTLEGHNEGVIGVSFNHDGQMLASTSYDRTVKLWKRNGTLIKTLEGHSDAVIGVSFSPNGQLIASASDDHTIKLWNCEGTLHTTLQGHDAWVMGVTFSSDGQLIASASADHTVRIWSCDGTLLTTLEGHDDWVFGVSFSFDGQILASASADRTIKLWNLNSIERNVTLNALVMRGCDWLHNYLKNNPNISQEDRCLCLGIRIPS